MTADLPAAGGPAPDRRPPTHRPLKAGPAVLALVLLAIPVMVLLIVPIYARDEPELFGFPFFYWFQMLAVLVASGLSYAAWVVVTRARGTRGRRR